MATTAEWHPERPAPGARSRYSTVAMILHWLIALAIFYNLASGFLRPYLPSGFFLFHTSAGLTALALTVVRIVWRLTHRPPPMLPMASWEKGLAHAVHFLVYVAMIALPLTGWIFVSANPPAGSPGAAAARAEQVAKAAAEGKPAPPQRGAPKLWLVAPMPLIGPVNAIGRSPDRLAEQRKIHDDYESVHGNLAWIMLALLVLHVGGALKHQFVDREPELERMGIGRRRA